MRFRIPLIAGVTGLVAAIWAAQGFAALPPQYDRWNEFAAIANDGSIPRKLGLHSLAERIERVGDGRYRVHGGKCYVAVALARRMPTGPKGEPVIGSAVISVAEVTEPRCA
jgi:hypothetical protein